VPELPEVETIRRSLASEVEGRAIEAVRIHHSDIILEPDSPRRFRTRVSGRRIRSLGRRGKYLLIGLDDGGVVQVQLRMSGRFAMGRDGPPKSAGFGHIAAEFVLDDGRTLYYDDVRRLGGFRLLSAEAWKRLENDLGPEPLSPDFTAADLAAILGGTRTPVKNALMDQHRIAGVGNIYASEALHMARLDPRRRSSSLRAPEVQRLHRAVRRVLREAIHDAGTTLRDYRSADGSPGRFQERLRVYGRVGMDCARCGSSIRRIVQAGRSTFFCSACQG
jgi:formamidopyrimidine-DNA glycosylase